MMIAEHKMAAEAALQTQGKSCRRRTTMRNRISTLVLALVVGAGLAWAAPPTTDSQTTQNIQSRLDHTKLNQHGNEVRVSYAGGVATLTGTVDSLGNKLDAEKAAQKVHGVTQVVDNLRVQGASNDQVLDQARHDVVMYYAYGIFDNVNLAADHGTLTVSGQVTMPFKKNDLGRILQSVKGVAVLNNDLEVLPVSNFDDRLRQQVARSIYGDPYFMAYRNQPIPSIHIIVDNGHVTLEGVVGSAMDRTKANMDALGAGISFSVVNNLQIEKRAA
jgi:hyperosmotically inducible protein